MIKINVGIDDQNLLLEQFFNAKQAGIWTAIPGIIQSFDTETLTCEVQPAVMGRMRDADGTVKQIKLPLLLDCPVVFPHAGGCSMTFPIKPGDECLVVFSSRGIDFWWQNGGIQPPPEPRMHDLSDGFVILAPYSQPKKIGNVSTETVQLRSDDGQAFIELHPTTHNINTVTPANLTATVGGNASVEVTGSATLKAASVTIDTPTAHFTGNVNVDGDVTAGSVSLKNHTHNGVDPGSGNSGTPNQ